MMARRTGLGLKPRHAAKGFTLIELMVSVVVAMLFAVLAMRVFGQAESQKRVTAGGNDAMINASLGLFALERDARHAGHGITAFAILGCRLTWTTTSSAVSVTLSAAPLTINAAEVVAGDPGTDTLLVFSATSNNPSEGDATIATSDGTGYRVATPGQFAADTWIAALASTRVSACSSSLDKVTAVDPATSKLAVAQGTTGLPVGSIVFDLGSAVQVRAYAVRQGSLTVCDYSAWNCGDASKTVDPDVWPVVASNIVSLRAQYGRDTTGISGASSSMKGVVDSFDQVTPGSASDTSAIATQCRWARVLAVRMAVVARSVAYDKTAPTAAAPAWDGTAAAPIDLSRDTAWQRFRYKTLQATVPLRNLIWDGSQSTYEGGTGGC
jgi:type IV pilus assembly protein PilW